jgi:general stress protein YciG
MTDFKTALIQDPKLSQISDQQVFGVRIGASNNTYQEFAAVSDSASSLIFNCQLPSESVVLSRDVTLRTKVKLSFTSQVADLEYGKDVCLAPFPLAMGMQSISSQINNSTVSLNLSDILPQLLCMNDSAIINKWQGTCPTLRDEVYLKYDDAQGCNNNPFANLCTAGYEQFPSPRGAHPAKLSVPTEVSAPYTYELTFETAEPLFLSPYIFGHPDYNLGGFVGINTVNVNCNMTAKPDRVLRSLTGKINDGSLRWGTTAESNPFKNDIKPALLLNFLSSQSTQLIPARQVLPYADFPRYITPQSQFTSGVINVNNIQLNQLPDKFIICVRKKMSNMKSTDSDSFFPISNISVNLNNQSGLLSSASREQLWRMSVEAGSMQSYSEFRGKAYGKTNGNSGTSSDVPTIGSLLVLDPAMHLSLPAMLTSGSIGQFSFNIQLTVDQMGSESGIEVEAVVVCMNSGIMVNAAGSSAIYTGILTKEMVVATATESDVPPMDVPEYERMVGGRSGNFGALKRMLASKLGRRGGAHSGGAHSGGAHSGGVRRFV